MIKNLGGADISKEDLQETWKQTWKKANCDLNPEENVKLGGACGEDAESNDMNPEDKVKLGEATNKFVVILNAVFGKVSNTTKKAAKIADLLGDHVTNIVNKGKLNRWWVQNEELGDQINGLAHLFLIGGFAYFTGDGDAMQIKQVKSIVGTSANKETNKKLQTSNHPERLCFDKWSMLPTQVQEATAQSFHQTTFYKLRLQGITEFRWVKAPCCRFHS